MDEKINKLLQEYEILEKNRKLILAQKQNLTQQLEEISLALEELNKIKEGQKVYKMIGTILFEKDKEELIKDLKETKEFLEIKLESLEKQEKSLDEKIKKLQEEIKKFVKQ